MFTRIVAITGVIAGLAAGLAATSAGAEKVHGLYPGPDTTAQRKACDDQRVATQPNAGAGLICQWRTSYEGRTASQLPGGGVFVVVAG